MSRARRNGEGRLAVWCPGCHTAHAVSIAPAANPWTWNGSLDRPTLSPSLGVSYPGAGFHCHSYVEDGRIRFLADSKHALAGQTVDLPEWPFPEED